MKGMSSLSNVFRFDQPQTVETKILGTKKIDYLRSDSTGQVMNPVRKKQYSTQDVDSLKIQYQQLQNQMKIEQEKAQTDIDLWWQSKKEEAAQEAHKLSEEAFKKGFQDGFDQGILKAEEEIGQKRQEMQNLIQTAYDEKTKIIQQSEPFLLSLSVKVARKVMNEEFKLHQEQLVNIVKRALKQVEETEDVVMQVSPEDYTIILPFLEELKTYVKADSELKVIPLANLSQGGCMIHTASGSYDVTVDGQLLEIKKHLLAHCEEKANNETRNR